MSVFTVFLRLRSASSSMVSIGITETGHENMTRYPFDAALCGVS